VVRLNPQAEEGYRPFENDRKPTRRNTSDSRPYVLRLGTTSWFPLLPSGMGRRRFDIYLAILPTRDTARKMG
jgi:hypothetical protein